jgi:hypothetical protein
LSTKFRLIYCFFLVKSWFFYRKSTYFENYLHYHDSALSFWPINIIFLMKHCSNVVNCPNIVNSPNIVNGPNIVNSSNVVNDQIVVNCPYK